LMREYCYQRNQEFQRDLGPRLVHFTAEQLVAHGNSRGVFTRPLHDNDIPLLSSPVQPDLAKNLALSPTVEDIRLLAQQTAQKLERLEMIKPGADLLADEPSFFRRASSSLTSSLWGTGRADFFSRLHEAVNEQYLDQWRQHINQVNREL